MNLRIALGQIEESPKNSIISGSVIALVQRASAHQFLHARNRLSCRPADLPMPGTANVMSGKDARRENITSGDKAADESPNRSFTTGTPMNLAGRVH